MAAFPTSRIIFWEAFFLLLPAVFLILVRACISRGREESTLRQTGTKGTAEILAVQDLLETVNGNPRVQLALRITPPGHEPFETTALLLVKKNRMDELKAGTSIAIRYDSQNPKRFILDAPPA